MTLSELRKLAESATSGPFSIERRDGDSGDISYIVYGENDFAVCDDFCDKKAKFNAEYIQALNPSTALRMIELLERAAGYIQNAELKECVNCPENSPTPIEECRQCQTARTAYKWLKDLEEL